MLQVARTATVERACRERCNAYSRVRSSVAALPRALHSSADAGASRKPPEAHIYVANKLPS